MSPPMIGNFSKSNSNRRQTKVPYNSLPTQCQSLYGVLQVCCEPFEMSTGFTCFITTASIALLPSIFAFLQFIFSTITSFLLTRRSDHVMLKILQLLISLSKSHSPYGGPHFGPIGIICHSSALLTSSLQWPPTFLQVAPASLAFIMCP